MPKNSAAATKKSVKTRGLTSKSAGKYLHVAHFPEGWIIHSERSTRARSVHATQREAVEVGRALAQKNGITLVIHHRDGRVKSWNSYRREPLPPPKPRKVLYPRTPPRTASREAIRRAVIETIREAKMRS